MTTTIKQQMDADELSQNKSLADIFSMLASYYIIDNDEFRAKTFANVSTQISNYDKMIFSGEQIKSEMTKIGESTIQIIDEYLLTGKVKRLELLEQKYIERKKIIDYFKSFYGIGPVLSVKFYSQGFRNLEDLWLKGNLTESQKIGILWRHHIKIPIKRDEIDIINNKIHELLHEYGIKYDITGSYRREEKESGDIDILVESREDFNMSGLLELLKPIISAKLAQGPTKFMGILRLSENYCGHRVDIRLVDNKSYPFALLYFTGSQIFNILMRNHAILLGYKLNEYGLYDKESKKSQGVELYSEEDIFKFLSLKYIPPNERTKTLTTLESISDY